MIPATEPVFSPAMRALRVLVPATAALCLVVGFVTATLIPVLAARHPLLMLALDAPPHTLILARNAPLVPMLAIATLRRVFGAMMFYWTGRWHGEKALRWIEEHTAGGKKQVERAERWALKAAHPLVFFYPVPLVCVSVGVFGMSSGVFYALATVGAFCVAALYRYLGGVLSRQIDAVLDFFTRHTLQVSGAFVLIAVVWLVWQQARAPKSPPPTGGLSGS